jgi:predicted O-linked N-acetylglucosamine transferase (SPINDLY family)
MTGQVAALSRERGIDIAVDLGGYTKDARPGIFAHRAAPVQVGYAGYLGTMGAPYYDYLIADPILVPEEQRRYYRRKDRVPSQLSGQRLEASGLGAPLFTGRIGHQGKGPVFCCFSNPYKITPSTFAMWMRILRA